MPALTDLLVERLADGGIDVVLCAARRHKRAHGHGRLGERGAHDQKTKEGYDSASEFHNVAKNEENRRKTRNSSNDCREGGVIY